MAVRGYNDLFVATESRRHTLQTSQSDIASGPCILFSVNATAGDHVTDDPLALTIRDSLVATSGTQVLDLRMPELTTKYIVFFPTGLRLGTGLSVQRTSGTNSNWVVTFLRDT
jgi:hypothetical protein